MPDAPFDPEGSGYDYTSAANHGIKADKTGHWPSRVPTTGLILKGRKHKTFHLTIKADTKAGYSLVKLGKRYYSLKTRRD